MVENLSTHSSGCVVADGARVERDSATIDVNATALRAEDIRCQFNGAMEEVSEKVQKTSTHIATSCVAADGAGVECDVAHMSPIAHADEDAAALHPEKGTSIQRGDG